MFRTYPPLASLKERLSFLFENDPRSQSVIAKQAGISQPSFSDLLTGRTSTSKHLEKIAEAFDADYQWVLTGIPSEDAVSVPVVNVPLLENYKDYLNTRAKNKTLPASETAPLDIKAFTRRKVDIAGARYVPMPDTGMEPQISENAMVFFDSSKQLIEDKTTYVMNHGGILLVRQLFNLPMGGVRINAFNSEFEDLNLSYDEIEKQAFSVIGKVFAVVNFY